MDDNMISLKRNDKGGDSFKVSITLPMKDWRYLKGWARDHNTTLSRAIHDHVWMAYHAEKGDYLDYDFKG